jgi:hypothetical protein
MTLKHLLLVFSLLLQACNDGLGDETYEPDERESAMPLASGPYEDMLNREAAMVAVVPPIPNMQAPWSGSPNLGNTADYAPDSNMRQVVLKMDEWGPPEVWSLSLGIESENWVVGDNVAPVAEVVFGSGGANETIYMDWHNGARITLPMNTIVVTALYDANSSVLVAIPPEAPEMLKLTAMIGRGALPDCDPTLTAILPNSALDVNNQYVDIPPFARSFELMAASTANIFPGASTQFSIGSAEYRSTPKSAGGLTVGYGAIPALQTEVPIMNGARSMRIQRFSSDSTELVSDAIIIWHLAI